MAGDLSDNVTGWKLCFLWPKRNSTNLSYRTRQRPLFTTQNQPHHRPSHSSPHEWSFSGDGRRHRIRPGVGWMNAWRWWTSGRWLKLQMEWPLKKNKKTNKRRMLRFGILSPIRESLEVTMNWTGLCLHPSHLTFAHNRLGCADDHPSILYWGSGRREGICI